VTARAARYARVADDDLGQHSGLQEDRHRAVIDEPDLHVSAEDTCRDGEATLAQGMNHRVDQWFGERRRGRS
jgi:hypothetical protein